MTTGYALIVNVLGMILSIRMLMLIVSEEWTWGDLEQYSAAEFLRWVKGFISRRCGL